MKRIALAILFVVCLISFANAKAQRQRQTQPCENAPSQYEADECAHKEYVAADAELNKVYNQLAAKLEAGGRAKLKAAEASWLKYRDDNCAYEEELYEGGSMQPLIYSSCLERMTKSRTTELRGQLKDLNQ